MTDEIRELEPLAALGAQPATGRSLEQLEGIIERGQRTFLEVGRALMEIRDGRLYREHYATFEDYCRDRWGWGRSRAEQLISASNVVDVMGVTSGNTPRTERQVRELASIPDPEERQSVWEETVIRHGPEPTARQIAAVRDEPRQPVFEDVRSEVRQQVREQEGPRVLDKFLSHGQEIYGRDFGWLLLNPSESQRQEWLTDVNRLIGWLEQLRTAIESSRPRLEAIH